MKELREKYDSLRFDNSEYYNSKNRLIYTLESIEIIETIISKNEKINSIEEVAFILLNLQFIGSAQEQLARNFTEKHAKLASMSFAHAEGKTNKNWFGHDRLAIAHATNIQELISYWCSDNQSTLDYIFKLKDTIRETLCEGRILEEPSILMLNNNVEIKFEAGVLPLISQSYKAPNIRKASDKALFNIRETYNLIRPFIEPNDLNHDTFVKSPLRQALILLAVQVIWENLKDYMQKKRIHNTPENWQLLREYRNRIAHGLLFRNLVRNTTLLWEDVINLPHIIDIEMIEHTLKNKYKDTKKHEDLKTKIIKTDLATKERGKNKEKEKEVERAVVKTNHKKKGKEKGDSPYGVNLLSIQSPEEIRRGIIREIFLNLTSKDYEAFTDNIKRININEPLIFELNEEVRYEELINGRSSRIQKRLEQSNKRINFIRNHRELYAKENLDIEQLSNRESKLAYLKEILLEEAFEQFGLKIVCTEYTFEVSKGFVFDFNPTFNSKCKVPKNYALHILSWCLLNGDLKAAGILLDHGANINITVLDDFISPNSLLHDYINREQIEVIEFLLKNGIDPNIVDSFGNTPLSFAIGTNYREAVNLLIKFSADIEFTPRLDIKKLASTPESKDFLHIMESPFCRSLKGELAITVDLIKAVISQDGLEKMKRVLSAKSLILTPGRRISTDCVGYALHYNTQASKLITTLAEICLSPTSEYRDLYEAILLNNAEGIKQFFADKNPQMICNIFKYKIPILSHRHESQGKPLGKEGFSILQFSQAMDYPQITEQLKQIFSEALNGMKALTFTERLENEKGKPDSYRGV
ncbi:hypothetical protein I862_01815 [endosymbiont of Acanthamoeba sp. UWC8]|uniref:ankyrin repeat domain-containing protein n=1 Tax=endosymbiont of Acanthamoeba sp. UWC8 TaxID=86106 RepID=UPI0004D0E221|nr:ankyrin repeat domain-containing protein [endosymbiont of Acanthamoeba sp. UWC8]AIF80926.1 hypothetical protein I862_01815 [endosymbiont of Acanthamoeba sp. UWC8]